MPCMDGVLTIKFKIHKMKIIKPSFEIIDQQPGIEGLLKHIELAGRTCYKSEDKITEDSAKEFVERMMRLKHLSVLEHGTVYLTIPTQHYKAQRYKRNHYSVTNTISEDGINGRTFATTNYRVLVENGWMNDLHCMCEPTEYHEKRVTVKFMCDRVTGESFLRHRSIDEDHPTVEGMVTRDMEKDIDSFARESTRYCNYSKGKFGSELSVIQPPEFSDEDLSGYEFWWGDTGEDAFKGLCNAIADHGGEGLDVLDIWFFHALSAQWCYMKLIEKGWKAQQARRVLPMDIASPLVMTAFVEDWKHFFDLRCDPSAHPQARELAIPLRDEFIKRGLIES